MRGPSVPAGSRCDLNIVNYDFLPTFADLAGATAHVPETVDGHSFKAALFGQKLPDRLINRPLYFHYPHYRSSAPSSVIIIGDWKLQHFYEWPDMEFLYNLKDDLGERKNISASQPERATQMAKRLMDYVKSVNGYFPKENPNADLSAKYYDPSDLSSLGDGAGDD